MTSDLDKAGTSYWDQIWEGQSIPDAVNPHLGSIGNHVRRCYHNYFVRAFAGQDTTRRELLEIGCGRSRWLPYFAQEFGFRVTGLDYSEVGCDQTRAILHKAGVAGSVLCSDLFSPPADMIEAFDVVTSFGVVEHFTDTSACLSAVGRFLKPGGLMITSIPNLSGWVGRLQKLIDQAIYDVHVPLDRHALAQAHQQAGLAVESCEYFMGVNWGVINTSGWKKRWSYRLIRPWPKILSLPVWLLERGGIRIKPNRLTSPYIICMARKTGE